ILLRSPLLSSELVHYQRSLLSFPTRLSSDLVPMLRRDGLGMELHALDVELAMPYAHDLAVVGPGGELQAIRKVLAVDGERVVADRLECRRQALEKTDARMANRVGLAVHHTGGTYHPPAEGLPDRLVAKADAQDRAAPGEAVDGLERHAGLVGRAGPGRNDDARRLDREQLVHARRVVAHRHHLGPQLA